ncbi:MAG: dynamin family protein, partial [Thermodesulfobacteriota bacterium]|nr:dynamin family protein [Thermodesulfobacteriota bacterium]
MNEYERFKQKIQAQAETLQDAVQRLEDNRLIDGAKADRWKAQLRLAVGSMETPLVRIAVVGSVKSGKSTLINAVLGTDLLKRGAGIITAFITRIR